VIDEKNEKILALTFENQQLALARERNSFYEATLKEKNDAIVDLEGVNLLEIWRAYGGEGRGHRQTEDDTRRKRAAFELARRNNQRL